MAGDITRANDSTTQSQQHAQPRHAAARVEVKLLRFAAVALTAAAFVGGAGWLLQRRAKRRRRKHEPRQAANE